MFSSKKKGGAAQTPLTRYIHEIEPQLSIYMDNMGLNNHTQAKDHKFIGDYTYRIFLAFQS